MNKGQIVKLVLLMVSCQLFFDNYAQEIPLGTWRSHISFNAIHTVSVGSDKVYAASANGIIVFDRADNTVSTISKLDGLSSTNITQIALDQSREQVLIAYCDGDLDIFRNNEIINFDRLKTSNTITGSKRINHILVQSNFAYLSTDYGIVVFDLEQLEVKETYRDLGPSGGKIKIYQSTIFNDSIFLASEQGVLVGDINDNLLDFNNWRRFESGVFNGDIQSITTFNGSVRAAINLSGVHRYENGVWILENFLQGLSFQNITGGVTNMLITEGNNLHAINTSNTQTLVTADEISKPIIAFEDGESTIWIGDQRNGLVSDKSGGFESYVPNGPSFSGGHRVKFDNVLKRMYSVSGGYNVSLSPLLKAEYPNFLSNGSWVREELLDRDLTDIEISGSRRFLSSFGYGIQVIESGVGISYDENNSPLVNIAAGRNVRVSALASSAAGVWVTNVGAIQSLHLFKENNTWESFSFPSVLASRYPTDIAVDYLGNVWMILSPGNGGGILVFDKSNNRTVYLTEVAGAGGLPSRSVYSIAIDRDGQVWIGTGAGVAYFPDPSRVFTAGINGVKPVFENRFLLRDEKVTAIEVDGGNRKWMGTERGVWLFNPFGEEQVYNFNATNSPLLSDKIVDMEINSYTGDIFFITDGGIVSFRSDATASDAAFHNVKIFPNPVTAQFNGQVGISGLATDAFVKITDVSGKLIWQTQASGGTAVWNVRDYTGSRAATGIYLVFSTAQDGSESVVGKIAIVD